MLSDCPDSFALSEQYTGTTPIKKGTDFACGPSKNFLRKFLLVATTQRAVSYKLKKQTSLVCFFSLFAATTFLFKKCALSPSEPKKHVL